MCVQVYILRSIVLVPTYVVTAVLHQEQKFAVATIILLVWSVFSGGGGPTHVLHPLAIHGEVLRATYSLGAHSIFLAGATTNG